MPHARRGDGRAGARGARGASRGGGGRAPRVPPRGRRPRRRGALHVADARASLPRTTPRPTSWSPRRACCTGLRRPRPGKHFFNLAPRMLCPNMKLTTLEKVRDCLANMSGEVGRRPGRRASARSPPSSGWSRLADAMPLDGSGCPRCFGAARRRYSSVSTRRSTPQRRADVLVIGSGIAGLTAALEARRAGRLGRRRHEGPPLPRRARGTRRAASPARWARPTASSSTSPTRSSSGRGCATSASCARSSGRLPRRSPASRSSACGSTSPGRRGRARARGRAHPAARAALRATRPAPRCRTRSPQRVRAERAHRGVRAALPRRPAHRRGRALHGRARHRRRAASWRCSGPTRSCWRRAARARPTA